MLAALQQAGPLNAYQVRKQARLSAGEVAYHLRTTPGVEQLDDKRWRLKSDAAGH